MVDQYDELLSRGRDNLLLQERTASALDEIEAWIDLIRSVDRHVDDPGVVLVDERDTLLPSQLGSLAGGRHTLDRQSGLYPLPERQHHITGGGAGAKPHDVTILHILNGCSRCSLFESLKIVHVIVSLLDHSEVARRPSGVTAIFLDRFVGHTSTGTERHTKRHDALCHARLSALVVAKA